jgi:excisionase family DNA binding protein
MEKRWLTPTESAEVLGYGFTDGFIRRQIELGRLRAVAFDAGGRRTTRIDRSELERFRAEYITDAADLAKRFHADE